MAEEPIPEHSPSFTSYIKKVVSPDLQQNGDKKDPQNEVIDFFKDLKSWREDSQLQLTSIMNSYNNSINKGITNLIQENINLKNQLSVTVGERNVLKETVDNLSSDIKQLNAKLLLTKLVENQNNHAERKEVDTIIQYFNQDSPEVYTHEVGELGKKINTDDPDEDTGDHTLVSSERSQQQDTSSQDDTDYINGLISDLNEITDDIKPIGIARGHENDKNMVDETPREDNVGSLQQPKCHKLLERPNLSKKSTMVLKKWLYHHRYNAYPSETEKLALARETDLSVPQV